MCFCMGKTWQHPYTCVELAARKWFNKVKFTPCHTRKCNVYRIDPLESSFSQHEDTTQQFLEKYQLRFALPLTCSFSTSLSKKTVDSEYGAVQADRQGTASSNIFWRRDFSITAKLFRLVGRSLCAIYTTGRLLNNLRSRPLQCWQKNRTERIWGSMGPVTFHRREGVGS